MTDPVSKILTGAVRISESHKTRSAGAGRPKTGKQLPDGCQHPCQGQQSFQHSRGKNSELSAMATHPMVEFCSWETPQNPAWTQSPRLGECGTKGAAWV